MLEKFLSLHLSVFVGNFSLNSRTPYSKLYVQFPKNFFLHLSYIFRILLNFFECFGCVRNLFLESNASQEKNNSPCNYRTQAEKAIKISITKIRKNSDIVKVWNIIFTKVASQSYSVYQISVIREQDKSLKKENFPY